MVDANIEQFNSLTSSSKDDFEAYLQNDVIITSSSYSSKYVSKKQNHERVETTAAGSVPNMDSESQTSVTSVPLLTGHETELVNGSASSSSVLDMSRGPVEEKSLAMAHVVVSSTICTPMEMCRARAIPAGRDCVCGIGTPHKMFSKSLPKDHPVVRDRSEKYRVWHCQNTESAVTRVCQECYDGILPYCKHQKHENLGLFRLSLDSPWRQCTIISASSATSSVANDVSHRPDWHIEFQESKALSLLSHPEGAGFLFTYCKECLYEASGEEGLPELCSECEERIGNNVNEVQRQI